MVAISKGSFSFWKILAAFDGFTGTTQHGSPSGRQKVPRYQESIAKKQEAISFIKTVLHLTWKRKNRLKPAKSSY